MIIFPPGLISDEMIIFQSVLCSRWISFDIGYTCGFDSDMSECLFRWGRSGLCPVTASLIEYTASQKFQAKPQNKCLMLASLCCSFTFVIFLFPSRHNTVLILFVLDSITTLLGHYEKGWRRPQVSLKLSSRCLMLKVANKHIAGTWYATTGAHVNPGRLHKH